MSTVQPIIDKLLQLVADASQSIMDLETAVATDNAAKDQAISTAAAALEIIAADLKSVVTPAATPTSATTTTHGH